MKPQSCKSKGRRLQQMIAKDLLEMFTHLNEDDIRSTSMGCGGEDVVLSQAARASIPFSFEAKNQERVNIWGAIAQAKTNTPADTDYAVVFKKNQQEAHVALSWKTFLKLLKPKNENAVHAEELHSISKAISNIANNIK